MTKFVKQSPPARERRRTRGSVSAADAPMAALLRQDRQKRAVQRAKDDAYYYVPARNLQQRRTWGAAIAASPQEPVAPAATVTPSKRAEAGSSPSQLATSRITSGVGKGSLPRVQLPAVRKLAADVARAFVVKTPTPTLKRSMFALSKKKGKHKMSMAEEATLTPEQVAAVTRLAQRSMQEYMEKHLAPATCARTAGSCACT